MDQTSMADALTASPTEPVSTTEAPAQETTTSEVAQETTTAPVETSPQASTEAVAPAQSKAERGFLAALRSEREKRQALEEQLKQLQSQDVGFQSELAPQAPVPQVDQAIEIKRTLTDWSEAQARRTYADFPQALQAYEEAIAAGDSSLLSCLNSPDPGEAVYQAGQRILFQKTYGRTPQEIRASMEKELAPKIKAQVEAELLGKLKGKQQQPTNILNARAAGGDSKPEWRPTGFADVLGTKR